MSDVLPDLLARVIGILLLATVVAVALRRQSASVRALAWTIALGGTLLVPALVASSPRVEVPILASEPTAPREMGVDQAALQTIAPIALITSVQDAAAPLPVASEPLEVSTDEPRFDVVALLLGAWMLGALALLVRLVASHVRLGRMVSRASSADEGWRSMIDEVRGTLGIVRSVDVRRSTEIDVPAVAGIFTPVLLLPVEDEWTTTERRDVALHELAHVARWDALSQAIDAIACAAYWFVPLSWYAARQAALLREQACDNVVLGAGTRPATYAERLIALARAPRAATLEPVALAMARPARLHRRILGILDPSTRRTKLSARRTAAFVGVAFAFLALVAVVQPVAAEVAGAPDTQETDDDASRSVGEAPPPHVTAPAANEGAPAPSGALTTTVSQQQPRPKSPFCRGEVDHTSMNRNGDGDDGYWRLTSKGPGCDISVRVEGELTFNAAFTDVTNITGRGEFDVDATVEGVRRQLSLRDDGDRISRTYRVDGRERPYDAEAAAWFGEFLIALDRQTAFAVDTRLPLLLRQGGVTAVLGETGRMPSDYARATYYRALSAARRLSTGELRQVLDQAASLARSDYYAAELLKALARQDLTEPTVRAGVMRVIEGMDSDYYKSESVKATVSAGPARNAEIDLLLRVVNGMKSDYYKSETVKLLLSTSQLSSAQLAQALTVVAGMKSDFHISELLGGLAARGTLAIGERRAYLDAAGRIESDYYQAEALKGLLATGAPVGDEREMFLRIVSDIESDHYQGQVYERLLAIRTLSEADLLAIERAARAIESDHFHAQVLQRIATHAAATPAVSDAVYATADGLSRHYRDELRRLVGRQ